MSTAVSAQADVSAAAAACRVGVPAAIAVAALAAAGFVLGILTPPRSGPWCVVDCTIYPYLGAARFFPRDYFWMLPGILLAPMFLTVAACVHFCIPPARRVFSLLAVCCATAATSLIALDYFVQVLAVQPSLEHHQMDGVAFFAQYNPHGIFLVLEDLGYLLLAEAFVLVAVALPKASKGAKPTRWTMSAAGVLVFVGFVAFAIHFGSDMALPFELAVITIVWIGLIPIGLLMARWFRLLAG